jgi:hypothetical protein
MIGGAPHFFHRCGGASRPDRHLVLWGMLQQQNQHALAVGVTQEDGLAVLQR